MMRKTILSNTTVRILVSVFAIPIILILTYLGGWFFFSFVLLISLLSFFELNELSRAKGSNVNLIWGTFGISFFLTYSFLNQDNYVPFLTISVWFLILLLIELFRNKGSALLNIGLTSFGFLFFSISGTYLLKLRELFYSSNNFDYVEGAYLVISILITIWICDTAAFFGGTKLGKHKLFPRVSPNKSWEGAIFGFVSSVLSMILLKNYLLNYLSLQNAIYIGVIIGILGQFGDLIESLLKRDAGIKDSSNLIPGHGGVFDRFDSLFYSAPFIYFFINSISL